MAEMKRKRSHASAKKAGTAFERSVADYLRDELDQPFIDRAPKTGARDKGDIANLVMGGERIAVECKNTCRMDLPRWLREAHTEAENLEALAGIVVHKRTGKTTPGDQYVTMTLETFTTLVRHANGLP